MHNPHPLSPHLFRVHHWSNFFVFTSILSEFPLAFPSETCCHLLQKCEKSGDSQEVSSLPSPIGGDVKLGTKDDGKSLLDISLSPLGDFHNCERLHQDKPFEV